VSEEADLARIGGEQTRTTRVEAPDALHRRVARPGPDGRVVEVLAARRGVAMRAGPLGGAGGGGDLNPVGIVLGFVVDLVVSMVATAVVEGAAQGRPWKVRTYRRYGPFVRRLHRELLPAGAEPGTRMLELLDHHAPRS